jgi:hypothetical protein
MFVSNRWRNCSERQVRNEQSAKPSKLVYLVFPIHAIGNAPVFVDKLARRAKISKLTWTGSSMVEQLTLNQRVAGSSPARFTTSLN